MFEGFLSQVFAHATPVEGIFSTVAIVSAVVAIHSLREAMIDSAVQSAAKINGPRRMIADNNIHQEQLRLGISLVMVLAAITFLFLEPPPPDYYLLPQSLVGLVAWIIVASIVMVSSLVDKSIRRRLQQYAPLEITTTSVTVPPPVTESGKPPTEADVMQTVRETREAAKETAGRRASDKEK